MTDAQRVRAILENRSAVLRHLVDAPATKPEIVSALHTSRSTVDRAIRDLVEIDCVTETNGAYESTPAGRLALAEHDQYRSRIDSIRRSAALLNRLPTRAEIDPVLLDGASVTLSEPHAPDQALVPSIELFEQATTLKGLAPVVLAAYPDLIAERLARTDLTVEIIAEKRVISTLPDFADSRGERLLDQESLTLYEADDSLPYALWLMDTPSRTHAGITAYDSGGVAGVLINDSAAAVDWAHAQYRQYRERAHRVSPSDV